MNGATAWNPAPARTGSRCRHVRAESGNPCRHSASGPDPASRIPKSRSLARTVRAINAGAAMPPTYSGLGLAQLLGETARPVANVDEPLTAIEGVRSRARSFARDLDPQATPFARQRLRGVEQRSAGPCPALSGVDHQAVDPQPPPGSF